MEAFKNYFKNYKEVKQFFAGEVLKFSFMSDGVAYYESLIPKFFDTEYVSFKIGFFYEELTDLFCYASFNQFLEEMQLMEVVAISEDTGRRVIMYFKEYEQNK